MSKIYLEVQVPGNAKTYEFSADNVMTVGKVKKQFVKQITAVENRAIFPSDSGVLFCSKGLEGLLQDHEILSEIGVVSGDTIILI